MGKATAPTREVVRITCRAAHPTSMSQPHCGAVLGDLPAPVKFVGVAARRPGSPDGRIRLQCPRADCRTWNVFEVIAPE